MLILLGNVGLIKFNSFFIAEATFNTLDLVCLTTPSPIAFSLLALKKPLSLSAPIIISATSPSLIFLLS